MERAVAYKIAVMGGGSWGTTVASLVSRNADIMLWARDAATVDDINGNHKNSRYLGDAPLNPKLQATLDPAEAIVGADAVVMGIPSNNFRSVLTDIAPDLPDGAPLISLTKGLERGSRLRMTEICREVAPGRPEGGEARAELVVGRAV